MERIKLQFDYSSYALFSRLDEPYKYYAIKFDEIKDTDETISLYPINQDGTLTQDSIKFQVSELKREYLIEG